VQRSRLDRSLALWERAERVIPAGTQTFSKGARQHVKGAYPTHLVRGKGSHVFDVDGNEYIDYPMALGPVILGYADPVVNEAVRRQLEDGVIFSLPHPLEVELAERLTSLIPCAEMVRFAKNGSDVTAAAVRLARAHTGRELVATCGYHGWQDWYIAGTTRDLGVPKALREYLLPFRYNDLDSLEAHFRRYPDRIACVIMEPVGVEPPTDGYLEAVKELAHRHGAVLIFDEILTGFRFAMGGAQQHFGVTPDLACFGKAVANGLPLSVLVGRRDIMRLCEEAFISMTFGGETLSLAAALVTLRELERRDVIPGLWDKGRRLQEEYNRLAESSGVPTRMVGLPPRMVQRFEALSGGSPLALQSLFLQETARRGVLFGNGQFLCDAHSDADIERTLRVCEESFAVLRGALESGRVKALLEGEVMREIFRKP